MGACTSFDVGPNYTILQTVSTDPYLYLPPMETSSWLNFHYWPRPFPQGPLLTARVTCPREAQQLFYLSCSMVSANISLLDYISTGSIAPSDRVMVLKAGSMGGSVVSSLSLLLAHNIQIEFCSPSTFL